MSRSRWVMISGLLTLVVAAAPAWAALKIGVVDYAVLLQRSPQAQAVRTELNKEFGARQKALQRRQAQLKAKAAAFQKNEATMSATQRTSEQQELTDENRDLSQQISDFKDDVNTQQNQAISQLQKQLVQQVQRYAAAQKFDLVLASGVLFASPAVDITSQVLQALQSDARDPGGTH